MSPRNLLLVVPLCAGVAGSASASLYFSSGPSIAGLGTFTGSMTFVATGATTGQLSVELTNTSPIGNSGWLTAFAFNVVDGVSLSLAPGSTWNFLVNPSGSPYGMFDFGASTSSSWEGGGPPSNGIAIGSTGTTVFNVSASAAVLASLTDHSFFDDSGGAAFAARFRGFNGGGSDKVMGVVSTVPSPGALALLGLAGIVARRRR